ncbi:hypothetical protein E2562_024905 [Oryza meyeriana var. granulata]|uniref:Uncharacterized protein n=1 Tax=Oryza meyeriana var. granulata TaxID=110450 RepID=A0A6G1DMZ2_9ORYZ|nr:hypothetical protein E2562_024905 [Oryza meyeriana var. granulata]
MHPWPSDHHQTAHLALRLPRASETTTTIAHSLAYISHRSLATPAVTAARPDMSRQPLALAALLLLLLLAADAAAGVDAVPGAGEFASVGSSAMKSASTMAVGADPDPSPVDGIPADPAPDARG